MSRNRFDDHPVESDQEGVTDIMRRLNSVVRVGEIMEVDPARGRARVKLGGNVTTWLKWHTHRAGDDQEWNPPSVKEQVTVLSPSGRFENAVILPGLFNKKNDSPSNSADHRHIAHKDGSHTFHDVADATRQVSIPGKGSITNFLGDKTLHSLIDGEHIFKAGDKLHVSMHKDYLHLHFGDSGIKLDKTGITITGPMLNLPPDQGVSGTKDKPPKDNSPKNKIPKSGGTSTRPMPGNT